MKYVVFVLVLIVSSAVFGENAAPQTAPSKRSATAKPKPKPTPAKPRRIAAAKPRSSAAKPAAVEPQPPQEPSPTPVPLSEKEQFARASSHELAADRIAAIEKFLADFPESEDRIAAAELLASSRVLIAEEKLFVGASADAAAIFRRVVEESPQPIPKVLFSESIAKIPLTLFRRGQRSAAIDIATLIESKIENDASQLLEIANFYLNIENGAEAMRVAAKAAARDPESAPVHRTLALVHRINFDLELSADSYARALELDPESTAAKRGLADMKRALGKSEEAIALYRELLAKDDADIVSRSGLILSLFEAGRRPEAERELAKSLESAPGNFILLSGAAYWYASRGIGDKAVELAQKALEREPRYIWSHIALARGLMSQGKPVAAEQVLIKARSVGNFPMLEYELASARVAAGFFQEAAEDLSKHFSISPTGVKTRLGGRLVREENSLADLVAYERKASIFAPTAADSPGNAEVLKALLELDQKLRAPEPNESDIVAAADAFARGADKMRIHRQIYAASLLLQKRIAFGKVLELTKAAIGNTDIGLDVPDPAAAVMASELYEPRSMAFRRNDFLLVPEVPRQTLSAILRGRIEEIAGWALYQQENYADAVVRLRRAISVIPDNSAWWRSSMWRLGAALAADGKDADALDAYIKSYKTDKPDFGKYAIVAALYTKIHGNIDGLEEKIGSERVAVIQRMPDIQASPTPAPTPVEELPAAATSSEAPAENKPAANQEPTPAVLPAKTESEIKDPPKESPLPAPATAAPPESDPPVEVKSVATKTEVPKSVDDPANEESTEVKRDATKTSGDRPKEASGAAIAVETAAVVKQADDAADPRSAKPDSNLIAERTTVRDAPPPAAGDSKASTAKPLFEPIIIKIPNSRPARTVTTDPNKPAIEKTPPVPDKADDATVGTSRPRVIDGREVKVDQPEPCAVVVSQETVSLINNGGSVGILVNIEGPGDIKSVTTVSSSPKDIEVTLEPEIGGVPDRRFYVIRSISPALGVYQVTFLAPCGKKELVVTVR